MSVPFSHFSITILNLRKLAWQRLLAQRNPARIWHDKRQKRNSAARILPLWWPLLHASRVLLAVLGAIWPILVGGPLRCFYRFTALGGFFMYRACLNRFRTFSTLPLYTLPRKACPIWQLSSAELHIYRCTLEIHVSMFLLNSCRSVARNQQTQGRAPSFK